MREISGTEERRGEERREGTLSPYSGAASRRHLVHSVILTIAPDSERVLRPLLSRRSTRAPALPRGHAPPEDRMKTTIFTDENHFCSTTVEFEDTGTVREQCKVIFQHLVPCLLCTAPY